LRGLVAELVWIEVVVSEFDCRVSLACHLLSFPRTDFLGNLIVEAERCIGKVPKLDCRFLLRFALLRIRVRLLESGGERIQLRSSSVPPSHKGDNSNRPDDRKERKKE
jgi:hypothetical protein